MKVDLNWMIQYFKITRAAFYRNIKAGHIPAPTKSGYLHASWDKEEIMRKFPNGWRKIPEGGVTRTWMCRYFGIKNTWLHVLVKKGKIPSPVKLSQNKCYWIKEEIINQFPEGKT